MRVDEYSRMFHTEEALWWYVALRHFLRRQILKFLPPDRQPRILDAGCGTGINLQMLTGMADAYGIDFAPEAVSFCRQRNLQKTARASIFHLPFAEESFDAVTCMDVLGHSFIVDDIAALREVKRVLKPGGLVFLHVAALEMLRGPHDEVVMFDKRYSRGELRSVVSDAGFTIEQITFRNSVIFPPLLIHRQLSRLLQRDEEPESDVRLPYPLINRVMLGALKLENHVAGRVGLPIGCSLFCVARKVGSNG